MFYIRDKDSFKRIKFSFIKTLKNERRKAITEKYLKLV